MEETSHCIHHDQDPLKPESCAAIITQLEKLVLTLQNSKFRLTDELYECQQANHILTKQLERCQQCNLDILEELQACQLANSLLREELEKSYSSSPSSMEHSYQAGNCTEIIKQQSEVFEVTSEVHSYVQRRNLGKDTINKATILRIESGYETISESEEEGLQKSMEG